MGDPVSTLALAGGAKRFGSKLGLKNLLEGPSAPDIPEPATRPEREIDVEPEDIELGGVDALSGDQNKPKGKRALLRPSGAKALSGLNV